MNRVAACNRALALIGAKAIVSLESNQTEAIRCAAVFDGVLHEVLGSRAWLFASSFEKIDKDPTKVDPRGYNYFRIPSYCLRVLSVTDDPNIDPDQDINRLQWKIEGRHILAHADSIFVRMIDSRVNSDFYPPVFMTCFCHRLASELAASLAGPKTKQQMDNLYQYWMGEASAADGVQGKSKRVRSESRLTTGRH